MRIPEIGAAVKQRRSFLKIDQKSLSELSGVSIHTISDIESGRSNPTIKMLSKVIEVLGMDLVVKVENES